MNLAVLLENSVAEVALVNYLAAFGSLGVAHPENWGDHQENFAIEVVGADLL